MNLYPNLIPMVFRIYLLLSFYEGCLGISVTEVVAPLVMKAGGTADLECRWHLRREEKLYSVKWYHGRDEIYRYTPSKHHKSVQVFSNRFLKVDPRHSLQGRVRVSNISLDAEGLFRCEVSAEAPAFYTDYGTINITVVALPDGGPHIIGVEPQYQLRDWVDLTCVSPESKPPTRIALFVNGKKPPNSWLGIPRIRPTSRNKQSSSQRIQFSVIPDIVGPKGVITVQCDAEIPGLHCGTAQVHLVVRGPFLASVLGDPLNNGAKDLRAQHWVTYKTGIVSIFLVLLL